MTKRERCFDWGCACIAIAALSPTTMAAEPSTTVALAGAPDAQAKPAERPIVLPQIEITGAYKQAPKTDRKSTRLNFSHHRLSRMPSSA